MGFGESGIRNRESGVRNQESTLVRSAGPESRSGWLLSPCSGSVVGLASRPMRRGSARMTARGGSRMTASRAARAGPADELLYGFNGCNGFPGRATERPRQFAGDSGGARMKRRRAGLDHRSRPDAVHKRHPGAWRQDPLHRGESLASWRLGVLASFAVSFRRACSARWLVRRLRRPSPEPWKPPSQFPPRRLSAPSVRRAPRRSASKAVLRPSRAAGEPSTRRAGPHAAAQRPLTRAAPAYPRSTRLPAQHPLTNDGRRQSEDWSFRRSPPPRRSVRQTHRPVRRDRQPPRPASRTNAAAK